MPKIREKGVQMRIASGDVAVTKRQADTHRASIRVGNLLTTLDKCASGKIKLSTTQIKAHEILLNKALPTLQAQDITVRDESPKLTPEELKQQLGQLIRSMPREEVNRLLNAEPDLKVIEGEVLG